MFGGEELGGGIGGVLGIGLGDGAGERGEEAEAILEVAEFGLGDEPIPVEIGIANEQPGEAFDEAGFEGPGGERGEEQRSRIVEFVLVEAVRVTGVAEGGESVGELVEGEMELVGEGKEARLLQGGGELRGERRRDGALAGFEHRVVGLSDAQEASHLLLGESGGLAVEVEHQGNYNDDCYKEQGKSGYVCFINQIGLGEDFENGFDFDGDAGGKRGEADGGTGVEAVAGFPVDLVEEVGGAVDDEVVLDEVRGGVDAPEEFQDTESIEGAVGVPDGVEDLGGAIAGGGVAVGGGESGAEFAFEGGDVSGGDEEVAGPDTHVEVAGGLLFEGESERLGGLLRGHRMDFRARENLALPWRLIPDEL